MLEIVDLEGQRRTYDSPLVVANNKSTLICNGTLEFKGCDGIQFQPTKPTNPVRVSMLSLRDLDIVAPDGVGLTINGGGKETTVDNVRVTAKTGVKLSGWDGGSVQNLYCFDCANEGLVINRLHAAQLHATVRQAGGIGVRATALRGVQGSIYSESNGLDGVEFENCDECDLTLHLENNNRSINGVLSWESMGHRFRQMTAARCTNLRLSGYWGQLTGQWVAEDAATAENLVIHELSDSRANNCGLLLPEWDWDQFWTHQKYVPIVRLAGRSCVVAFPCGCFDHANQNRAKYWLQRWMLSTFRCKRNELVRVQVNVGITNDVCNELGQLHDNGDENGLGTIGFLGFSYQPTASEKGWTTLHAWNGDKVPAAITKTWVRENSPVSICYQPCVGIASWDNPEFEVEYRFWIER